MRIPLLDIYLTTHLKASKTKDLPLPHCIHHQLETGLDFLPLSFCTAILTAILQYKPYTIQIIFLQYALCRDLFVSFPTCHVITALSTSSRTKDALTFQMGDQVRGLLRLR